MALPWSSRSLAACARAQFWLNSLATSAQRTERNAPLHSAAVGNWPTAMSLNLHTHQAGTLIFVRKSYIDNILSEVESVGPMYAPILMGRFEFEFHNWDLL